MHMSCEKTCNMQHRAKKRAKTMQKSCHAKSCHAKSCHAKSCHAKTMQHAARTLASTLRKNVQAVRVMQKTSCSTCHEKTARKTVQTCKNHATCGAYAGVYAGRRGKASTQGSAASLLYVLYVLYLTRQATEHPLPPGSMLYVLYVLYLTRQATEHPLPPGSMLYVLYVLYLTRQATEHPLSPSSMLYVLYVLYGPI